MHRSLWTAVLLASAACAPGARVGDVSPDDLAALDARRAANPDDPRTLTSVGVALYRAGAHARARDALQAAVALDPTNFTATVHLGLASEGLRDYDAALAAYRKASGLKIGKAERRVVEDRLASLARVRLAELARRAIAEERTLASAPSLPNSIAVLPWTYVGQNPELKPLERGLAHLLMTDLAKLPRFTLLEREQIQAMSDELALAAADRTAPGTAARSGRLLGAEQVIAGVFRDTERGSIRLDATVITAATSEVRATGTASDRLEQLFAMEKALLFDLLDRMAIIPTPAERRALTERPTADIQSFLAFSRGLEAEDRGDFSGAAVFYQQAATRDPSFNAARTRADRSVKITAASKVTGARISAMVQRQGPTVRGAQLAAALQNIAPSMGGRHNRGNRAAILRSRLAEALRQDDAGRLDNLPTGTIPRP
jgi:tetratricopeptide (TPR) repeat protein